MEIPSSPTRRYVHPSLPSFPPSNCASNWCGVGCSSAAAACYYLFLGRPVSVLSPSRYVTLRQEYLLFFLPYYTHHPTLSHPPSLRHTLSKAALIRTRASYLLSQPPSLPPPEQRLQRSATLTNSQSGPPLGATGSFNSNPGIGGGEGGAPGPAGAATPAATPGRGLSLSSVFPNDLPPVEELVPSAQAARQAWATLKGGESSVCAQGGNGGEGGEEGGMVVAFGE